jgi:hypothetical protein
LSCGDGFSLIERLSSLRYWPRLSQLALFVLVSVEHHPQVPVLLSELECKA